MQCSVPSGIRIPWGLDGIRIPWARPVPAGGTELPGPMIFTLPQLQQNRISCQPADSSARRLRSSTHLSGSSCSCRCSQTCWGWLGSRPSAVEKLAVGTSQPLTRHRYSLRRFFSSSRYPPVIDGLSVLLAYLDWRRLRRQGVVRPFHWAWGFLIGFYIIGRSVVVRKVAPGRGLEPLWAHLAVVLFTLIVAFIQASSPAPL